MAWGNKPSFLPLDIPTASQLKVVLDRIDAIAQPARKTALQNLATSSVTLVDVTDMFWTVSANQSFFLNLVIFSSATGSVPDLKIGFTAPSGAFMDWGAIYVNTAGAVTVISGLTIASTLAIGADTSAWMHEIRGVFTTVGTAGTLQLQAAQNVSDPATVTIKAGTYGVLTQVT